MLKESELICLDDETLVVEPTLLSFPPDLPFRSPGLRKLFGANGYSSSSSGIMRSLRLFTCVMSEVGDICFLACMSLALRPSAGLPCIMGEPDVARDAACIEGGNTPKFLPPPVPIPPPLPCMSPPAAPYMLFQSRTRRKMRSRKAGSPRLNCWRGSRVSMPPSSCTEPEVLVDWERLSRASPGWPLDVDVLVVELCRDKSFPPRPAATPTPCRRYRLKESLDDLDKHRDSTSSNVDALEPLLSCLPLLPIRRLSSSQGR